MKRIAAPTDKAVNTPYLNDFNFSQAVIDWQRQHGRHNLPWQQSRDAYRVWLSEVMLQQTQVATVIAYYQRFLTSFPTIQHLALASSEQVMAHWSGLGYYSRARNLHACAKRVVAEYDGVFPSNPDLLADLPGIGLSTAAAIAAFAYGVRAAILDGNVKRVFTRFFGIDGVPSTKIIEQQLWVLANQLLPPNQADMQSYTQGLMDLGATLCTRTKAQCSVCPLQTQCVAFATNRVAELPTKKPPKTIPTKQAVMLIVQNNAHILLEKRPPEGIWGGLYSLPELPQNTQIDNQANVNDALKPLPKIAIKYALQAFGELQTCTSLPTVAHSFTHFKLQIHPVLCELKNAQNQLDEARHIWWSLDKIEQAPLPAPIKKILLTLQNG